MSGNTLGFIGGGNMTIAIVGGLLDDGYLAKDLLISEPSDEQRTRLSTDFPGVRIVADNSAVAAQANIVVLAVKPQVMSRVCQQLANTVQATRPLVMSIAAGIRSDDIDHWLGGKLSVIRVMPNQPALVRAGMSGLYANNATSARQLQDAVEILSTIGEVVTIPAEKDIDAVTALSGNGPAYFYLLFDMLIKTGVEFGLETDVARKLAVQTGKGAALLAGSSDETFDTLIEQISSPGGTTVAALECLEEQGIRDIFAKALVAARDRAVYLADSAKNTSQD